MPHRGHTHQWRQSLHTGTPLRGLRPMLRGMPGASHKHQRRRLRSFPPIQTLGSSAASRVHGPVPRRYQRVEGLCHPLRAGLCPCDGGGERRPYIPRCQRTLRQGTPRHSPTHLVVLPRNRQAYTDKISITGRERYAHQGAPRPQRHVRPRGTAKPWHTSRRDRPVLHNALCSKSFGCQSPCRRREIDYRWRNQHELTLQPRL